MVKILAMVIKRRLVVFGMGLLTFGVLCRPARTRNYPNNQNPPQLLVQRSFPHDDDCSYHSNVDHRSERASYSNHATVIHRQLAPNGHAHPSDRSIEAFGTPMTKMPTLFHRYHRLDADLGNLLRLNNCFKPALSTLHFPGSQVAGNNCWKKLAVVSIFNLI